MQNDLTTGSVFRNVVSFSLPYLLSYFLQTLYGMADLFIIGQFEGVASTTAVSIGSQVMHMLTVMLVGLAMGATVSIAQATGGGDKKRTASAIGNTVTLFMLLSLALTALLLALRGGIVSIMSTPEEAVQGTLAYLTVCFIGIPFITAYNIIASIFRGLGDSKSPMYFIAVACVVNIALDYYFMGTLHLGPAGAALGTTLSQAVSVLVSLAVILKRRLISVRRADFRPQRAVMGKLLQIGVPVALQDGFIQVSFVIITIIANRRRHRRKDHRLSLPHPVVDALDRLGARRAEYRRGQARACASHAALRRDDCLLVRHRGRHPHPVYRRAARRPLHA